MYAIVKHYISIHFLLTLIIEKSIHPVYVFEKGQKSVVVYAFFVRPKNIYQWEEGTFDLSFP